MSQITLDSIQLKTTAIIFAEHNKLKIENPLLREQIKYLEDLNTVYEKMDSIKNIEIELYKEKTASDTKKIKNLESSQRKNIIFTSVGGIVLFIIGLIL